MVGANGLSILLLSLAVSAMYAVLGVFTLWQTARNWRSLVDADYTHRDRQLAVRLGFFLLTPPGVLVHELAHLVTAKALGAAYVSLSFFLYTGFVDYLPRLGPNADFTVAAAGPMASLALGLIALIAALRISHPWRHVLSTFGMATLLLVLVVYPLVSYWFSFGDFRTIYGTSTNLSLVAAAVHVSGLVVFLQLARRLESSDRRATWTAIADIHPGVGMQMSAADAARLQALEHSWTRFLPGMRQELTALRQLRDWIEAHNRSVQPPKT